MRNFSPGMHAPNQNLQERSDLMHIPAIRVAFVLSLLLHLLLLATWRSHITAEPPSPDHEGKGAVAGSLRARLAPPPAARPPPAPAQPPVAPSAPSRPSQAARAAPPRKPPPRPAPAAAPPLLSRPDSPRMAQPSQAPPSPPTASAPIPDMAALVEARQRARAASAAPAVAQSEPVDEAAARSERNIAANLGSLRAPSPGENQRRGGGVFQIRRIGAEDGEFLFFGWNPDMRRNNTQVVEVRRGSNSSMQLAIVRRMIEIIRTHENGDFVWESQRLHRNITLSARAANNAELEAFMLQEFF